MPETITVHVNRGEHGSIDVDRTSIETDRSFEVAVHNHGEPVHLHVNPSEEVADTLSIGGTNRYVESDESITIPISVGRHTGPLYGRLDMATRFGAYSASTEITLTGGVGDEQRVEVDERLTRPQVAPKPDERLVDRLADVVPLETIALVGFLVLALLAGVATIVVVDGQTAVVGLGVVLVGVGIALFLLLRGTNAPDDTGT